MAPISSLVPRYEEVERCDSWGTARIKQRALEETYGNGNVFIFKDMSNRPFTALLKRSYVVMLRVTRKTKEIKEAKKDE